LDCRIVYVNSFILKHYSFSSLEQHKVPNVIILISWNISQKIRCGLQVAHVKEQKHPWMKKKHGFHRPKVITYLIDLLSNQTRWSIPPPLAQATARDFFLKKTRNEPNLFLSFTPFESRQSNWCDLWRSHVIYTGVTHFYMDIRCHVNSTDPSIFFGT
jgi:hypothetical protein